MSRGIRVDPVELQQPARRFEVAADGLDLLAKVIDRAAATVSANAGQAVLSAAAGVYGQATGAVVDAFADESRLMGNKTRQAAVTYRVTDENAVVVSGVDLPPASGRRAV